MFLVPNIEITVENFYVMISGHVTNTNLFESRSYDDNDDAVPALGRLVLRQVGVFDQKVSVVAKIPQHSTHR